MTRTIRRAIVVAWCAFIFWESSRPDVGEVPGFLQWVPMPDKFAHIALFGCLAVAVYFACVAEKWLLLRDNPFAAAVTFTAVYGASDEIHQLFTPRRTSDVFDLAADIAGAFLFAGGLAFFRSRRANANAQIAPHPIVKESPL